MTNSHAENAQDGQDRPDASDALGTPDAPAAPQASDARGGGQDGSRAGQDAPGGQYGYGSGQSDQSVGGDSGAGGGGDVSEGAARTEAAQGGDEAGQVAADAPGEQAADEATRRLAKAVLAAEQALIEFEIAVETFRVEVENFSRLHHQRLGPMYARLDELDAQIAEAVAARTGAPEDIRKAQEARASVLPMPDVEELFHGWIGSEGLFPESQAMLTEQPVRPPQKVRPSEEARKVYRDLVRKAHPDLARDDAERARRDEFIARVNAAYGRGDEAALRELVREWESGPAPVEERLSESEELYARLEWLAERKELLAAVAAELEDSAIGAMIKMAPQDPDALLEEIAEKLLADVAEREAYLAQLVG
ncbi:J domain-containing protein [Streptomyces sp. NPDC048248]|uniref:J domain-containing protein n=1 Tax=Streptomyces sp. NPDC048248 TaxID=3365523 RepID=UPI00371CB8CA